MVATATSAVGTVLIEHDKVHGPLLDRLEFELAELGHCVRRGNIADYAALDARQTVEMVVTTSRGRVDAAAMTALERLHTVILPTTGIEAVDLRAATELGVAVANGATTENVISMAEATAMLILTLLYRLPSAACWSGRPGQVPPATMLRGKSIGLIGFGAITQALIPRLQAFEAKILVRSAREGLEAPGVRFVEMDELLTMSDVVCVLGALTSQTTHLLGRDQFARMKTTAFLVNTARGAIVNEAALCEALATGLIAGAALDTFEHEPLPRESPLRSLPGVILTPHCIGHTRELANSIFPAMLGNIAAAHRAELPPLCKNPEVLGHWRRLHAVFPTAA